MDGDVLQIAGWALPPEQHAEQARFLWNGTHFAKQEYPIVRPDLGAFFAQRRGAEMSGYVCSALGGGPDHWFDEGCLHLRFEFDEQGLHHPFQHDYFYPDNRRYPPLPESDRIYRVMGANSILQFLLGGYSDFNKIKRLVKATTGDDVENGKRVLDWGVGCGRVGRYFSATPGIEFFGVDVDADNVDWCRRHLPGRYAEIPLHPPIPMEGGSFDLIYGISVLTHLRETDQLAWLAELHRIAAPGAIVLLTFHGTTAANYSGLPFRELDRLLDRVERKGFVLTGGNDQLRDFIGEANYYANVFHSKDYVRRIWGEHFEVIDIVPGMIATHDLAVLRKR
ncbi:MAG: class I SAM-dependent methyltransferase [Betaproteobacteria bacterium]